MPKYHLPNGKVIYTQQEIPADQIDDFLDHDLTPHNQSSADEILTDAKKSLGSSQFTDQVLQQKPQQQLGKINPELSRKDTTMFDINYNDINNWISNQASKLPSVLQKPAAMWGSANVNFPLDFIQSVFGAPESPVLMGAGALKNAANITERISKLIPQAAGQKLLGPATTDLESLIGMPTGEISQSQTPIKGFFGGPSEGSGQVASASSAVRNPSLFTDIIGRNPEPPINQSVDLGTQQELDRIANLNYTGAEQHPGSAMTLLNRQPSIPPESGDIRGGFQPQTNQEMGYPYNVLPNLVRPRVAQTEILSQSSLRGLDLSRPVESGSDIHFISGGPDNPVWPIEDPRSSPSGYFGTGQSDELLPPVRGNRTPFSAAPISDRMQADMLRKLGGRAPDNTRFSSEVISAANKDAGGSGRNTMEGSNTDFFGDKIGMAALTHEELNRMRPVQKPLDIINSSPIVARSVEDINKIPPGQADVPPILMKNGNDMSAFRAQTTSPHIAMENFPESIPVIKPIIDSNDEKLKWLATTERKFAQLSKGLNRQDRGSLMMIMNGEEVPGASPDLYKRAQLAKNLTDSVYDLAKEKSEKDIGFIDRYITHIQAQSEGIIESAKSIISHQIGKESPLYRIFTGDIAAKEGHGINDYFEKGMGNPTSPFIKSRNLNAEIHPLETDYNRIMPIYLESMTKVIHDKPAIDSAMEALKTIPDGKLKEYLTGYIKNYSRYDADPELANAWNALTNQIATINARSVISFNPVIHAYHAGQLPANVWPELGTKYSTRGLAEFLSHPIQSYQELARNGLFSNMIRPMQFQTPAQKFDSVGYFMNMVESIVKGTGYYGFKQKALDSGMNDIDATMHAIQQTKNVTATIDPARHMRYFTPESNVIGGQGSRLLKQYHQIPMKLVEQFAHAASNFKDDPAKVARYITGTTVAGIGAAEGLHTLHISPATVATTFFGGGGGQFIKVMENVIRYLGKGDIMGAAKQVAEWVTPAGASIKKGMRFVSGEE